ncbi:hypothetical protein BC829DRAFT_489558 [Chytridium lagenaria]|nr:hypothetical protein BC829DRAFT_489558 [Chytridium lagenaria]
MPTHTPQDLEIPVPNTALPLTPTFVDYTELVLTSPSKVFIPPPAHSPDTEVESLIQAMSRQVQIEKQYGSGVKAEEIVLEERLNHLKEFTPVVGSVSPKRSTPKPAPTTTRVTSPLGAPPPVPSLEELLQPKKEKTSLAARFKGILDAAEKLDDDEDIDLYCCICDRGAVVVCPGCEDDPYCVACWKAGHVGAEDVELRKHVAKRIVGGNM